LDMMSRRFISMSHKEVLGWLKQNKSPQQKDGHYRKGKP
jgi:hypothetical protein